MSGYKKKLIEVALPLEAINKEAARENYIYRGNPSAVHKWWAQRPLAACRAVLWASLVDDPGSRPNEFPTEQDQQRERERLFRLIEALTAWESMDDQAILDDAWAEIRKSTDGTPPPVMDPFCGAGSIPLEAQRLGLEAHASDLNPVAVLTTKALIEIPNTYANKPPVNPVDRELGWGARWNGATGLAADVRYYGQWVKDEAARRIGQSYPLVNLPSRRGKRGLPALAWLWARTVKCPNPACGVTMPLVRSFWLSSKAHRKAWVEPCVDEVTKTVSFAVKTGEGVPPAGTVSRSGAVCIVCRATVPLAYVRAEGRAGRIGQQLMAMVVQETKRRRSYAGPDPVHVSAAAVPPTPGPDAPLPDEALGFRVQNYGLTRWCDLFTPRQLLALCTLSDLIAEVREQVIRDTLDARDASAYATAVQTYLSFALSKAADYNCSLVPWFTKEDRPGHLFSTQTISITWDFCELNPLADIGGSYPASVEIVAGALDGVPKRSLPAHVRQADAASMDMHGPILISTDPPYYDNVPYADLSDFFFVWLRRGLGNLYPDLFGTLLTPKAEELIAEPSRHGGAENARRFFENGLRQAFERMRAAQHLDYPMTVYYAFKQAEFDGADTGPVGLTTSTGWETMLEGLIGAAFSITGTWPMRTERTGRARDIGSNALASSIVLVCRPRPIDATLAMRQEFATALKRELPDALRKLQHSGIAPVDLAQAAIGPGMAVYSRYAKVLEPDGSRLTVRTALQLINQALDEVLAEQEGEYDNETRWAIAWFEQFGMDEGAFGQADVLARAKGTAVNGLETAGIVRAQGGKVRLLSREELPEDWDPATDRRLTVWELTQHLIRTLDTQGEEPAARLLARTGALGETARDLAYRLYATCERKKWAQEALAYNSLVVAWPELTRLAAQVASTLPTQARML